jgi:hypothetical protein
MADLDPLDRARKAVTDRAELPGMSLMEHLEELRKRILHSLAFLAIGLCIAYTFHSRLYSVVQKPVSDMHIPLNYTHPTDPINLALKTSLYGGAILASPFILYQLWLFIAPGMYSNEKRYVFPFMGATVTLFLAGAYFGYRYVLPGALNVLILNFGKNFHPMLTIEDYTQLLHVHHLRPRHLLRAAHPHLLPRPLRHRRRQIPPPPLPLRHPRHLHRRRHHLPHAGPLQHVPLRQPHARPLLLRRSHRLVRPSQPPQTKGDPPYDPRKRTPSICHSSRSEGPLPF